MKANLRKEISSVVGERNVSPKGHMLSAHSFTEHFHIMPRHRIAKAIHCPSQFALYAGESRPLSAFSSRLFERYCTHSVLGMILLLLRRLIGVAIRSIVIRNAIII